MSTPRPRTYVVGLPVIVTVGPDGHLLVSVDASEMASAIWEDTWSDDEFDNDEMFADDQAIRAALEDRRYHVQIAGDEDEPTIADVTAAAARKMEEHHEA